MGNQWCTKTRSKEILTSWLATHICYYGVLYRSAGRYTTSHVIKKIRRAHSTLCFSVVFTLKIGRIPPQLSSLAFIYDDVYHFTSTFCYSFFCFLCVNNREESLSQD